MLLGGLPGCYLICMPQGPTGLQLQDQSYMPIYEINVGLGMR